MFAVAYCAGTYSDGTPIFEYAGVPCESLEEARDLAGGHENAKIYSLHFVEDMHDASYSSDMARKEYIIKNWGKAGERVCFAARKERKIMSMSNFLHHCTPSGGDWGTMILTGIEELYPEVYEAIPDDMGLFAFTTLIDVIKLCGVDVK